MVNISSRLENELRRLSNGPLPNEKPGGIGTVCYTVRCPFGAVEVMTRAKAVLKIIDEAALAGWPTNTKVLPSLPEWFTSACSPSMSPEQANQWLVWWKGLSPTEQTRAEIEKDWSLDNWLYWMEPSNRQWFWWDANVLHDYDHIVVAIEVEAWPFPWGALRWLFRVAGASAVEAEE